MKNNKLAETSTEELIQNEKKIKVLTLILAGALLVLFGASLFLTFKKGFTVLSCIPIGLLPILILNINNWNAIKKEIKSRDV